MTVNIIDNLTYYGSCTDRDNCQRSGFVVRGPFMAHDNNGGLVWRIETVTIAEWVAAFPGTYKLPVSEAQR